MNEIKAGTVQKQLMFNENKLGIILLRISGYKNTMNKTTSII